MADIILHVGISKTGTTHVQNQLFDCHSGLVNLGKPNFADDADLLRLNSAIIGEEFDAEEARRIVRDKVAPVLAGGRPAIWSEENFSFKPSTAARTAQRLKALFPDARILFTIREQRAFLQSMFFVEQNKALARGGAIARDIDDWLDAQDGRPDSILERLDYGRLERLYAGLFGDDRVHVLCFEDMVSDREAFVRRLAGVLGVEPTPWLGGSEPGGKPERARISGRRAALVALSRVLPLKAMWNRLPHGFRRHLRSAIDGGAPAQAGLAPEWEARLQAVAAPGNRDLAARQGLDLAKRGYWL
ncbi:MAG: sulfotransferase [Pseudomonadota bacterium]